MMGELYQQYGSEKANNRQVNRLIVNLQAIYQRLEIMVYMREGIGSFFKIKK
jgi:hypothetical protein